MEIIPIFFREYWTIRMQLQKKDYPIVQLRGNMSIL